VGGHKSASGSLLLLLLLLRVLEWGLLALLMRSEEEGGAGDRYRHQRDQERCCRCCHDEVWGGCLTVQRKVQSKMTATLADARGSQSGRWISWMRADWLCRIEAEVRANKNRPAANTAFGIIRPYEPGISMQGDHGGPGVLRRSSQPGPFEGVGTGTTNSHNLGATPTGGAEYTCHPQEVLIFTNVHKPSQHTYSQASYQPWCVHSPSCLAKGSKQHVHSAKV
jgi:hypothetical protein